MTEAKVNLVVPINADLRRRFKLFCVSKDISMSNAAAKAIEDLLDKEKVVEE